MITQDSFIQINERGRMMAIEDLLISNLIYDPKIRRQVEISDILSRTCTPGEDGCPKEMTPLYFPQFCLTHNSPTRGTWLSPRQSVCFADSRASIDAEDEEYSAVDLWRVSGAIKPGGNIPITYYALFCDEPHWMVVNGLMVRTYDPSVFEVERSIKKTARELV